MIFDPTSFLGLVLPKSFYSRKLYDVDAALRKKNQLKFILSALVRNDLVETKKTDLQSTVTRAIQIYKGADNSSTDDSLLKHNIENLLVYDKVQELKKTNEGRWYRWGASDAKVPDPEHQLLYGKVFRVGTGDKKGNMPGERYGCRCTAEFLSNPPK